MLSQSHTGLYVVSKFELYELWALPRILPYGDFVFNAQVCRCLRFGYSFSYVFYLTSLLCANQRAVVGCNTASSVEIGLFTPFHPVFTSGFRLKCIKSMTARSVSVKHYPVSF